MARLYPLCLNLTDRLVLIVGGGNLARQKLAGLAPTAARVRLVAPELAPGLNDLIAPERIEVRRRAFQPDDLAGVALAFGATDDPALNRAVVLAARARGILANAVDDPPHCDFHTPAVIRRGGLELAIATGGGFPGFARAVREVLEAWLPPEHDDALDGLFALRRALLASPLPAAERGRVLRELAHRVATDYLEPAQAAAWTAQAARSSAGAAPPDPLPSTLSGTLSGTPPGNEERP